MSPAGVRWRLARARERLRRMGLGAPAPAAPDDELERLEQRIVWILGSPRSGSSWLLRLLTADPGVLGLDETYLPAHLVPPNAATEGEFLRHGPRADDPSYFFARRYLPELEPELRRFVLRQLSRQAPAAATAGDGTWLAIKEPNGSHAAETIFRLLPRSRLLFLLRDGRDVVDSHADAKLDDDTWWSRHAAKTARAARQGRNRERFARAHAQLWLQRTEAVQRAFQALPPDRRLLVRYEDLRADTAATLARIHDWLGIQASAASVEATVTREAFEEIPGSRRGPGKSFRAATPGLWRQSLGAGEQAAIAEVIGEKLRELGYEP